MSDLPQGWIETTLGEVVELIIDHRGKTPKKLGGDWSSNGYRAISAKTVKNGGLVNEDKMNILSEELYRKWMKVEVEYGDIFLTSEAPLGEHLIWKSEEKVVLSQRIFGIRTNKRRLDPFYFNYFLDSNYFQHELKSRESGSTVTGIKQSELVQTNVILPPLPEQKAIAAVLSAFDDKIELLREQNRTLETLAQTIFKEWFVHFNFPDKDGKPYRDNGGEMVDSELGEIPKGWRVGKLGEEFDITIGRTPPRKEKQWFSNTPTGKKWASIKDMVNSGVYIFETSEYLTDEAINNFNVPVIPEGTVILSFKMTVGKLAIATEDMLSNEAIAHMKLKPGNDLTSEYIYLFLQHLDFNSLGSTSSIVTAINSTMIKQIQFLMPNNEVLKAFVNLITPIFKKIKNNTAQIQTLSNTRDTLLPKLMSGQLRIETRGQ